MNNPDEQSGNLSVSESEDNESIAVTNEEFEISGSESSDSTSSNEYEDTESVMQEDETDANGSKEDDSKTEENGCKHYKRNCRIKVSDLCVSVWFSDF